MPRILMGPTIEVHYPSPSAMVTHLDDPSHPMSMTFETDVPASAGATHDVVIHVPWLGQEVRLRGRIEAVEPILAATSADADTTGSGRPRPRLSRVRL